MGHSATPKKKKKLNVTDCQMFNPFVQQAFEYIHLHHNTDELKYVLFFVTSLSNETGACHVKDMGLKCSSPSQ